MMPTTPKLFATGEVQKLVGISYRRLDYWDRSSLVSAQGHAARGRGSRRLYTTLDVVKLKLVRRLLEAGIPLQKIRVALAFLDDLSDEPAPLPELDVSTDGRRILVRRSDQVVVDALTRQIVLRLPLEDLLAEVQDGIEPPRFVGMPKVQPQVAVGVE